MSEKQINTIIVMVGVAVTAFLGQGYLQEGLEHSRELQRQSQPAAEVNAIQLEKAQAEREAAQEAATYWKRINRVMDEDETKIPILPLPRPRPNGSSGASEANGEAPRGSSEPPPEKGIIR